MADAYHLPPSTDADSGRKIDPLMAAAAEGGGISDGSIYNFDVPHRGSNASIWLSIIVVLVVAIVVVGLLVRVF